MESSSAERRKWVQRYHQTGNISAVCREFGISRTTLYKWLKRSDPNRPSKALRSRSRRPLTRSPRKWDDWDFKTLAVLDWHTGGRLSAVRLSQQLEEKAEVRLSRSTVARLLAQIKKRCPVCKRYDREHDYARHLLFRDLQTWQLQRNEEFRHWGLDPPLDII